jgi:hypothetical protein
MVPLPETVLQTVFRNSSQQCYQVALDVRNVSKSLPLQGKSSSGLSQVIRVDGPLL